jgi:hypothetical protein
MSMTELDHPHLPTSHGFQKGHPRYGGRKKGSRNRFGGDLREQVVAAIEETGFIQKNDKGDWRGRLQGFHQNINTGIVAHKSK